MRRPLRRRAAGNSRIKEARELTPSQELYQELLSAIGKIGPFSEEEKKTCTHLVRKSAFAGVHPRKQGFVLTLKAPGPVASKRIVKSEQASKNRWHLDVRVAERDDIDTELLGWVRAAYDMSG